MNEWRTPPEIVEIVRNAMGGIDLDPCAPVDAPHHIGAPTAFTVQENGLDRAWFGKVYMNPPYGREAPIWVKKAMKEVHSGNAECVVAMLAARTDTRWFRPLLKYPVAYLHGRVKFLDEAGIPGGEPAFPSALVLIRRSTAADDLDAFARAVGDRGTVVLPWRAI
jgi:hypothetical protein